MIVVIAPFVVPYRIVLYRNGCYVVRCRDGLLLPLLFFLFLFSLGLTELGGK